jgi:NitT/TauT family transport system substrate-binding protein
MLAAGASLQSLRAGERMFRLVAAVALLLLVLPSPLRAQARPEPATLAIPAFSFSFALAYLAEDLGLWAKNGVAMKSVQISGVGSTNAVVAGSADFAIASPLTLTRAAAHGQRLLAIAELLDRLFVQIALRKDLAEAAHFDAKAPLAQRALALKGRTLAVDSINSIIHAYVRLMAHYGGYDPEAIRVAPMQPANMIAAFDTKQIDGFSMSLPWPLEPVLAGSAVTIADGPDGDPPDMVPFAHTIVVTRPETCERRRSLCAGTGKAIKDAAAFVLDHPQEAAAALSKRFAAVDPRVRAAAFEVLRKVTPRVPALASADLEKADTLNVEAGLMKPEEKLKSYAGLSTDAYVK